MTPKDQALSEAKAAMAKAYEVGIEKPLAQVYIAQAVEALIKEREGGDGG